MRFKILSNFSAPEIRPGVRKMLQCISFEAKELVENKLGIVDQHDHFDEMDGIKKLDLESSD